MADTRSTTPRVRASNLGYHPRMDRPALRLPFRLRERAGLVTVHFGPNEDPLRWGYGLLNLDFPIERARGFPVLQADVRFEEEGYAAIFGWVQIARYTVHETGETRVVYDVPPQLIGADTPYVAYGVLPRLFDAPSITRAEVTWDADSFLVHTPDALMTRVVHAICGFTWGYRVTSGSVLLVPPTPVEEEAWSRNLAGLTERFPTWTFGTSWHSP